MRMGGQVRAIPGCIIGFDMTAALAMGDALGIPRIAVVELLPQIEVSAVREMNRAASPNSDTDTDLG